MNQLAFAGLLLISVVACSEPADEPRSSVPAPGSVTPAQMVVLHEGTNLAFAADQSSDTLVLALQGLLFRTTLTGGDASLLLGPEMDTREPALGNGGKTVVFQGYAAGNWDLYELDLTGGEPVALTSDPWDDREPDVGPNGDIVFSSDRGGGYNIWVLTRADGITRQVTHEAANAHSPAWSKDGKTLAYVVDGPAAEIKLLDLVSGNVRVVETEPGIVAGLAWSIDGHWISYQVQSRDPEGLTSTTLRRASTSGGETSSLSLPDADVFPFRAAWLDESQLMFAVDGGLSRLEITTGKMTRIEFSASVALNRTPYPKRRRDHDSTAQRVALGLVTPVVSNDGEQIAFTALGDVWLWQPKGAVLQQLTDDVAAEQTPVFLPDGKSLLYVTDRPGKPSLVRHRLSDGEESFVEIAGATTLAFPVISHDGTRVAVFRDVDGSPLAAQLILVSLEDGSITELGKPMPPQLLSWSADDRTVLTTRLRAYSTRYREGVYELVMLDSTNGAERSIVPVAHRSLLDASIAADGRSVSFVQGGSLWRIDLDAGGQPAENPIPVTRELTDQPSYSANGRHLVFASGSRLKLMDVNNGAVLDVTPPVRYQPEQATERWVLRAGRLYDGRLLAYRENVDIVIAGHRIEALEPVRLDRSERVVDALAHTVIPGLFEMHAHMGATSARQGSAWLAWGITSVRDPGSNPYVAKERQEAWDSGRRAGPRTYVTGYLTDGNRVFYTMAEGVTSDAHLERALQRARELQYDFIKTYVRLPDRWQQRVISFAHTELGIPVSSHELYPAVAYGADHVEHIGGTSRRGYAPKVSALGRSYQDVIELLVASGMGITPTMVLPGFAVIAAEDADLFTTDQFRSFYGDGVAAAYRGRLAPNVNGARATAVGNGVLLRQLVERGALVVTGTDAPFVPYAAGLHAELRLYARAGLTPAQILHAATWQSAVAAHVENDLGSIEPGKVADLVVIDGDPLQDIAALDDVVLTVKGGRGFSQEALGVRAAD
jgi:Tol biopolymer transport system component/imidazolonepropionase-like amidohydrolase